jgi:hypothetical protein
LIALWNLVPPFASLPEAFCRRVRIAW